MKKENKTHDVRSKITEDAYGKLEFIAEYHGFTVSLLVRRLIMQYLKNPKSVEILKEYDDSEQ